MDSSNLSSKRPRDMAGACGLYGAHRSTARPGTGATPSVQVNSIVKYKQLQRIIRACDFAGQKQRKRDR